MVRKWKKQRFIFPSFQGFVGQKLQNIKEGEGGSASVARCWAYCVKILKLWGEGLVSWAFAKTSKNTQILRTLRGAAGNLSTT